MNIPYPAEEVVKFRFAGEPVEKAVARIVRRDTQVEGMNQNPSFGGIRVGDRVEFYLAFSRSPKYRKGRQSGEVVKIEYHRGNYEFIYVSISIQMEDGGDIMTLGPRAIHVMQGYGFNKIG